MTLNQIAERVAFALNDPLNIMLKENIKFSIKNWRATFIRRDIQANGLSPEFLQRIKINLIKVDKADTCNVSFDCSRALRSANPIPQTIRWKNDVPFKSVSNYDGKQFTYTEYEEIPYTCYNRFTPSIIRYCLINNYIYIFNNVLLKMFWLEHIFVDPYEANILCGETCYTDDSEFPFPADMVSQFISGILTGEFKLNNPVDETVSIDNDIKK